MSPTNPDREPCAAKGCTRWAQGFSRFCPAHRYRTSYTGSANGRILRARRDLGPFRELVADYWPRWKDHAAIVQACRYLDSLLVNGSAYTGCSRTHRAIAKELQRLRLDGATGSAMLAKLLAVAGYAHYNARTFDDGPCYTMNLAHHMLRTTPRPGATKVPGPAVYALGQEIRGVLGVLLAEFWRAVERDQTAQDRARDGINAELQAEPLG